QVPARKAVRLRGKACPDGQRLGDGAPLPGAPVRGEIHAVQPEGVVGGGAYQGPAKVPVHIGQATGVGQDGLHAVVYVDVEQVRVPVAAPQAPGVEVDI